MLIDFAFKSVEKRNLDEMTKFILEQNLGYVNHFNWIEKARVELSSGYKEGILAYNNGIIVGDIVFQEHKELPKIGEIKNIRVHPKLRDRRVASFMLRQAELEMPYDAIIVDARANQQDMISFLIANGYVCIGKRALYDDNNEDVIMIKVKEEKGIVSLVKNHFDLN